MNFSQKQLDIINNEAPKIIMLSSAASSKTGILTQRVKKLLLQGIDSSDIAVITFTNMAASELIERLGPLYSKDLFIGTIHSLANRMLTSAGVDTKAYRVDEQFDKLFNLIDKNPSCIKHFKYLFLDEAQDSDELQFDFILNKIKPNNFFFAADIKQSIYQFKGSRPDIIKDMCLDPTITVLHLDENYRNSPEILEFAKKLIKPTGQLDKSNAMRKVVGKVIQEPLYLPSIKQHILSKGTYGEWAVLTRTNHEIDEVCKYFDKEGIPYSTFKQGNLSLSKLREEMKSNTVKVLTVHSAKGLEWPYVMVLGMRFAPAEERNVCYVAATRARDLLIWFGRASLKKRSF